jgi:hypothetical protein
MRIQEEPGPENLEVRYCQMKIVNLPSELQEPPDHVRHDFVFFLQSGLACTGFDFGASC